VLLYHLVPTLRVGTHSPDAPRLSFFPNLLVPNISRLLLIPSGLHTIAGGQERSDATLDTRKKFEIRTHNESVDIQANLGRCVTN
jgi:hypothetical protein